MTDWSPAQYLRFDEGRLRPGHDLLARIPCETPRSVYDLGCGAGTLTVRLKKRWPEADVIGIDASPAMLAKARALEGRIDWREDDLSAFRPAAPAGVIYSNAALHWLDGHHELFPRLVRELGRGGCLAVQMPNNFAAPTHTAIFELAREKRWRARLAALVRERPVLGADAYHALLAPIVAHVDVWETIYYHALDGEDPVVEWTKGSVLRPFLDALHGAERESFLERYRARMREAYPKRDDGKTMLPFKRFFIVAVSR